MRCQTNFRILERKTRLTVARNVPPSPSALRLPGVDGKPQKLRRSDPISQNLEASISSSMTEFWWYFNPREGDRWQLGKLRRVRTSRAVLKYCLLCKTITNGSCRRQIPDRWRIKTRCNARKKRIQINCVANKSLGRQINRKKFMTEETGQTWTFHISQHCVCRCQIRSYHRHVAMIASQHGNLLSIEAGEMIGGCMKAG